MTLNKLQSYIKTCLVMRGSETTSRGLVIVAQWQSTGMQSKPIPSSYCTNVHLLLTSKCLEAFQVAVMLEYLRILQTIYVCKLIHCMQEELTHTEYIYNAHDKTVHLPGFPLWVLPSGSTLFYSLDNYLMSQWFSTPTDCCVYMKSIDNALDKVAEYFMIGISAVEHFCESVIHNVHQYVQFNVSG